MDRDINVLYKDKAINHLMNSVCSKYQKNIDVDQMESIKLNTLWECIKKYDENRGAKFTSFLYQQLTFALKNEVKSKRIKEYSTNNIEHNTAEKQQQISLNELFDGLPIDTANILAQKFVDNMTMVEIGEKNGYSRETARRKLKNAIKIFKQKNKIGK